MSTIYKPTKKLIDLITEGKFILSEGAERMTDPFYQMHIAIPVPGGGFGLMLTVFESTIIEGERIFFRKIVK